MSNVLGGGMRMNDARTGFGDAGGRVSGAYSWLRNQSIRLSVAFDRLAATKVGELLGADLRSLALFRVVMAMVVLFDIMSRLSSVRVHYSAEGVLPRSLLVDSFVRWRWSLNLINDMYPFQMVLFLFTALAAICMLLGYRTRMMTIVVWIMVTSIQVRNPLVLSGADTLLRVLMFWAMFLPLGARWSLDALVKGNGPSRKIQFLSFGTIALFLQIAFMYWFTATLKSDPEWRTEGTALSYALGAHHITKPFGEYLFQFPEMLRVLTHASLGLEFIAPILLFSPVRTGPMRTLAIASIMSLHLGIYLTMDVGIFPWLSAFCMACFLPAWFWDTVLPRVRSGMPQGAENAWVSLQGRWTRTGSALIAWNSKLARSAFSIFAIKPAATHDTSEAIKATGSQTVSMIGGAALENDGSRYDAPHTPLIANLFLAFALVFVFLWNMASVTDFRMPAETRAFAYSSGLYQSWNMFAPHPSTGTSWIVIRGVLENGEQIDLLTPIVKDDPSLLNSVSWQEPEDIVGDYYGSKYWRKYLSAIGRDSNKDERRAFAAYSCRTWNANHTGDDHLVGLQVIRMTRRTSLSEVTNPIHRSILSEYRCT